MPFAKGQSGNPGGRPKEDAEVKALAKIQGPDAISKLVEHMEGEDGRLAQAAAIALLDRGFGKPAQELIHTGDEDNPMRAAISLIEITPLHDNSSDTDTE